MNQVEQWCSPGAPGQSKQSVAKVMAKGEVALAA